MEYVPAEKVFVEFRMDAVPSVYQSEAAGHPVFVEKPFIRIGAPGQPNTEIDTIADEMYQKRFPEQWRKFLNGSALEVVNGWRIEAWPVVNTAQVKMLKHMGVYTVEMLADMSDAACQNVGIGTVELRAKAKAALSASAGAEQAEKVAAENKRLNDELETLKAIVAKMTVPKDAAAEAEGPAEGSGASSEETQRRRPGRPARQAEGA